MANLELDLLALNLHALRKAGDSHVLQIYHTIGLQSV